MKIFPLPLRFSVPAIILGFGSLLSLYYFQRAVSVSYLRAEEDVAQQATFVSKQTSGILEHLFTHADTKDASLVMSKLVGNPNLQSALLLDENNKVLFTTVYTLRDRFLKDTPAANNLQAISKSHETMSIQVVFSENKQKLDVIHPVTLGSLPGEIRPSRVGALLLEYNVTPLKARAFKDALYQSIEATIILGILCASVWLFFDKTVTLRATKLVKASNILAKGDLAVRTNLKGTDELAQISFAFDSMAQKVQVSQQELQELADKATQQAEQLKNTLQELQTTQAQLIQSEKMSSLGQMVAGIAHEINNPVNFIHGNIGHLKMSVDNLVELIQLYKQSYPNTTSNIEEFQEEIDLEFILNDIPKILSSMKLGTERIREIVLSLRNFSRLDETDMKTVNIHEGIDSTLLILQNRLKVKSNHSEIKVIKDYSDLPLVECYAGQLNQVFMNLLNNAIDAFDSYDKQLVDTEIQSEQNQITITTIKLEPDYIAIGIADNGLGMSAETKARLFDPFYTTKPVGKGTGLGLAITYQIISKHKGQICYESELGKGTQFWLKIPIKQY